MTDGRIRFAAACIVVAYIIAAGVILRAAAWLDRHHPRDTP